jgi:hypothetical protein
MGHRILRSIVVLENTYSISRYPDKGWVRGTCGKIFLAWNFWNSPSDSTPLLSVPSPLPSSFPVKLLANLVISFSEKNDREEGVIDIAIPVPRGSVVRAGRTA